MKRILIFSLLMYNVLGENEMAVIRTLSENIGNMVLECQEELEFNNDVIRDFMDFWNEKNELKSQDLGCAMVCVLEKNEFLSEDGKRANQKNLEAFFSASGADNALSRKLLELFGLCKQATNGVKNECESSLDFAKCFRYGIVHLHWAPEHWNRTAVPEGNSLANDVTLPAAAQKPGDPVNTSLNNLRRLYNMLYRKCS